MSWLVALVLGAIQGVTEFLPISSDGHLAVATQAFAALRGTRVDGAESLFFNVMLHLGTLGAILVYYRDPVALTFRGALGAPKVPLPFRRTALIRTGALAAVATLPAVVVGLCFKDQVEAATASPAMAAAGFLVTATVLLLTLRLSGGSKGADRTTWLDALLIGTGQAFAILPGVSRSGMTIATALGLGLSRSWSVGFSLLMAVPAILGAVTLELKEVDPATLTPERIGQTVAATLLAGLVGYGAIIWLIRIVRGGRLWYFSVYLVVLAGAVLLSFPIRGGVDAGSAPTTPLDRSDRVVSLGARPGADGDDAAVAGDRPDGGRPRPGPPAADPGRVGRGRDAGLDLGGPLGRGGAADDRSAAAAVGGRGAGGAA